MISRARLQRRLFTAVLGTTLLLSIIVGLPFARLKAEKESSIKLTKIRENADTVANILGGLINMETGLRGYLYTKDRKYLEPYYLGQKQLNENLPKLDLIPNHQKEFKVIRQLITEQIEVSEELIATPGRLEIDRQKRLMDTKRLVLGRLQAEEEFELQKLLKQRQVAWTGDLLITTVVILSVGVLLYRVQGWLTELIKTQESLELALAAEYEARIKQERLAISARDLVNLVGGEVGPPLLNIQLALAAVKRKKTTDDNIFKTLYSRYSLALALIDDETEEHSLQIQTVLNIKRIKATSDENFRKLYDLGLAGVDRIKAIRDEVLALQQTSDLSLPIKTENIRLEEWCFNLALELNIDRIKVIVKPNTLSTDKTLLRRALYNVLDNAVKYSEEEVVFRCVRDNDSLLFIVKDKGLGMPPEYFYKHLWQPFTRAHNVKHIPGEGLGLITARKSVERLGGKIIIASSEGVGTEVIVKLPATN